MWLCSFCCPLPDFNKKHIRSPLYYLIFQILSFHKIIMEVRDPTLSFFLCFLSEPFPPVVYLYEQHLSSSSPLLSPVLCLLSKRVSHFGTARLLQPHSFLPGRPLLRLIANPHHTSWFCSAEPWQSPESGHFSSFLPYCTASINQTLKFFTDASWLSLPAPLPLSSTLQALTCALAVLHVRLQLPALVTRTFHTELVLLTALTALKVFGTEALDLTGLVVGPQLHAQWTGTDHPFSGGHCAVMAAVAIVQWTQVCKKKKKKQREKIRGGLEENSCTALLFKALEPWFKMQGFACCYGLPCAWVQLSLTAKFLVGAIWAVVSAIAKFLRRQADGGFVGTHMVGELTHQCFAVVLVRVVLAVAVSVAHPGFADTACYRRKAKVTFIHF